MQHQSLFVFDIETVPDTDVVPNLTGFDNPDIAARREELDRYHLEISGGKNSFSRQPFHKVVAISFLEAEIDRDGDGETYLLRELRSGGEADYSEEKLVQGFFSYFKRLKPRLVSYNGRTFDLPVLKYRAMAYGIPSKYLHNSGDKWHSYTSRYSSDWHCDLLEVLSDYGASARCKLNEVCAVMGFPGKFGVDGAKVVGMIDEGRVQEVRDYCETDVLNTYLVYLRHQMHTGTLTTENYNRCVADVISLIETTKEEQPNRGEFLKAWGEACGNEFTV